MFADALSRMGRGDDGAGDPLPREGRDGSESLKFGEPSPNLIGVEWSGTGLDGAVVTLDASCKAQEKKA